MAAPVRPSKKRLAQILDDVFGEAPPDWRSKEPFSREPEVVDLLDSEDEVDCSAKHSGQKLKTDETVKGSNTEGLGWTEEDHAVKAKSRTDAITIPDAISVRPSRKPQPRVASLHGESTGVSIRPSKRITVVPDAVPSCRQNKSETTSKLNEVQAELETVSHRRKVVLISRSKVEEIKREKEVMEVLADIDLDAAEEGSVMRGRMLFSSNAEDNDVEINDDIDYSYIGLDDLDMDAISYGCVRHSRLLWPVYDEVVLCEDDDDAANSAEDAESLQREMESVWEDYVDVENDNEEAADDAAVEEFGIVLEEELQSTADTWNRIRDKERVEKDLNLKEFGNAETVFVERADPLTVIGTGYRRVLYGDHGPYIEFLSSQVNWEVFTYTRRKSVWAYYDEHYTSDGSVQAYEQKKTVADKPNPPPGLWSANHNRANGYADYQPGLVYVAADVVYVRRKIEPESSREDATASTATVGDHRQFRLGQIAERVCPDCAGQLEWSAFSIHGYSSGWQCNGFAKCGKSGMPSDPRWFCKPCKNDFCNECLSSAKKKAKPRGSVSRMSPIKRSPKANKKVPKAPAGAPPPVDKSSKIVGGKQLKGPTPPVAPPPPWLVKRRKIAGQHSIKPTMTKNRQGSQSVSV
mmetsp:Transcript_38906/g.61520  ORF Transcript_38906/g.61520 Transcript_38906/m.61520 type:complete len:635 (+) Transcript_38906:60-1964(+)